MKRFFCFLVLLIICSFIGCASQDVTVNDIVRYFDEDGYQIQAYNSEMIAEIQEKKLILNGEILSVAHATKIENEDSNLEWAYIYELSDEDDAIWLEENRTAFVSTIDNGTCIRLNKIVVFGNSSAILSLKR